MTPSLPPDPRYTDLVEAVAAFLEATDAERPAAEQDLSEAYTGLMDQLVGKDYEGPDLPR